MRRTVLFIVALAAAMLLLLSGTAFAAPQEIKINSMTGGFNLPGSCYLDNTNRECDNASFTIRSLPVTFNAAFRDTCAASNTYTGGATTATTCSLQNGQNNPGVVSAHLSSHGCGALLNSWAITWNLGTANIWYKDASRETFRLTYGQITGFNYAHAGVDTWEVTMVFDGVDFAGVHLRWNLSGTATANTNCGGGGTSGQVKDLTFAVAGEANDPLL